ncbi:MAG: redoxin domain-containing protein [Planctomycetes bacterium]|nr:redoxin domain-containing protein [Planctomycetota bacterium]MBI3846516.1 redoxin domain-containing protein [Planctomycetota bacterium]
MKFGPTSTSRIAGTLVFGALVCVSAAAQDKAKPAAAETTLKGNDANADFLTLRAAYEALDAMKLPEERRTAMEKLKPQMAEFIKLYDGKITEGPALIGLGFAQLLAGDGQKARALLQDCQAKLTNKPAPSLDVWKVIGGDNSWSLDQAKGKVVLVDFWATWCGPCRALIPSIIEISNEYQSKGLVVVGATQLYGNGWLKEESKQNLDEAAELKLNEEFKADMKIPYPIVFCKKNTAMFNYAVMGIPTVFLIDKAGKIRWSAVGNKGHDELKKKIDELLAENAAQ